MVSKHRKRAAIDALYGTLPNLDCQGKCAESCGPIAMTRIEEGRIIERTGSPPTFDATLTCSLLRDDRCTVYDIRPAICRLWGLVESMPCPWGCVPERYLSDREGHLFLAQVAEATR